jgi:hypothetical protein
VHVNLNAGPGGHPLFSSTGARGCARCTECATMGRHENGECRSCCAISRAPAHDGRAWDLLLLTWAGEGGMALARVIHVIRPVPCGEAKRRGPLARDRTTRRLRTMRLQIRRCKTPTASAERPAERLQCALLRPVESPGERQAMRAGGCHAAGARLSSVGTLRGAAYRPAFRLPASSRCNLVLLGGIWIVVQNLPGRVCERPASHRPGIAAVAWRS